MDRFTGRLSPFADQHEHDVGQLYILLTEGIQCVLDSCMQSPHWDRNPTPEMLQAEQEYEEQAERAFLRAEDIAREIYLALTGKKVTSVT
jgi:hypothetical protein